MFYSHEILQRRGGRFGKIWLAATKISKLTRREVASIPVTQMSDDILTYVELRMARGEGGRRPRLSLYLSAQLMYGVVRVHHKQSDYLLADATSMFMRVSNLYSHTLSPCIDLQKNISADTVTLPEFPEELEQEFQYVMRLLDEDVEMLTKQPSPGQFWSVVPSNGSSGRGSPDKPQRKRQRKDADAERVSGESSTATTVPEEQITMVEPPPMVINTPLSPIPVPRDEELPKLNGDELDMFNAEATKEPPLSVQDLLPTSTPLDEQRPKRRRRTRSQTQTQDESSTVPPPAEKTPDRAPRVTEVPETRAVQPSPEITRVITSPLAKRQTVRKSLELNLTDTIESPSQRRPRRKRQLLFVDAETQLPKEQLREHIQSRADICEENKIFYLQHLRVDLFKVPGTKEFPHTLTDLWTRNARLHRNLSESQMPSVECSPVRALVQIEEQTVPPVPEPVPMGAVPSVQEPVPVEPIIGAPVERPVMEQLGTIQEEPRVEETDLSRSRVGEELPSVEVRRDVSATQLIRDASSFSASVLDDSKQSMGSDRGGSTAPKRRRKRSSVDTPLASQPKSTDHEAQPRALFGDQTVTSSTTLTENRDLYILPEEQLPAQFTAIPLELFTQQEFLKTVQDKIEYSSETSGLSKTTFSQVCPPGLTSRKTAAKSFMTLLELCASKTLCAKQDSETLEIFIMPV